MTPVPAGRAVFKPPVPRLRGWRKMLDSSSNHESQAMSNVQETLRDQVTSNRVVLYMKGTPQFPQCGFSATVAEILKRCGVEDYFSVNVLEDPEIRQGIKEFANWPTIPQLYVDGEFIGGCDIVREMYASGELQKVLAPQTA
jgi:monothiol glutaredoxin